MDRGTTRLTLVVLAAGIGRRYGGAKQVEPVGPDGEWIIDYSVYDAIRAGFERVVFVIRDELEGVLRGRFDDALRGRCDVAYVHQRLEDLPDGRTPPPGRVKPWGTGHALLACRDSLDGPFAVINADDFYGRSGYDLLARFLGEGGEEHAVVGYSLAQTLTAHGAVSRGICRVGEDNRLAAIVERKRVAEREGAIAFTDDGATWQRLPADAIASMNMWGFAPAVLASFNQRFRAFLEADPDVDKEFYIPSVVGELVAEGRARVRVLLASDRWYGVTYREDLAGTRAGIGALVDAGAYPAPLWSST